jgi:hypothetical protein
MPPTWWLGPKCRKRQDSSQCLYRSESMCVLGDYSPAPHQRAPTAKRPPSMLQCHQSTGGWVPSRESDSSKSEQVRQCMDLKHFLQWLHLEPTHWANYCTWSPLTWSVQQMPCGVAIKFSPPASKIGSSTAGGSGSKTSKAAPAMTLGTCAASEYSTHSECSIHSEYTLGTCTASEYSTHSECSIH